jgi:hypothetical protein
MKIAKVLNRLYLYGETEYNPKLSFLKDNSLIEIIDNIAVITSNWIQYGKQFQCAQDHLRSLFCFKGEYQQYLLQVALRTVLKMRDAQDTDGLMEFVSKMPVLAENIVAILREIASDDLKGFNITAYEDKVNKLETSFQDLDNYIFNGAPQYQRIIYYLEKVQLYQAGEVEHLQQLGGTVDQNWQKGRKISVDLQLVPLNERPTSVLAPCELQKHVSNPLFNQLFTYPWKLFVFLWCVVREHYEAQGVQAVRFCLVDSQVDVLIVSRKNQAFRYGSFNEFATEFCHVNQYQLFPNVPLNLEGVFREFLDRKTLSIVDEEYRLGIQVEQEIYNTDIFIPLIAKSDQLRQRMQQWIDELRDRS